MSVKNRKKVKKVRSNPNPKGIGFRFVGLTLDSYFYDENALITKENQNMVFSFKPSLRFSDADKTITVIINYELSDNGHIINSIKTSNTFDVREYNELEFYIEKSNGKVEIMDFVRMLIDLSLGHTRGIHTLKIKDSKTPYLLMPIMETEEYSISIDK